MFMAIRDPNAPLVRICSFIPSLLAHPHDGADLRAHAAGLGDRALAGHSGSLPSSGCIWVAGRIFRVGTPHVREAAGPARADEVDPLRLIRAGARATDRPAAAGPGAAWPPSPRAARREGDARPRRRPLGSALAHPPRARRFCCLTTHWGRSYLTFARKTWIVWSAGRVLTAESGGCSLRRDLSGPALSRENTPEDAVILLPPEKLIDEKTPGDIPLLASPSSVYNFIYPRVPVHWGDPSPWRDRVNYILVWKHWGLDLVDPLAPKTEENRMVHLTPAQGSEGVLVNPSVDGPLGFPKPRPGPPGAGRSGRRPLPVAPPAPGLPRTGLRPRLWG